MELRLAIMGPRAREGPGTRARADARARVNALVRGSVRAGAWAAGGAYTDWDPGSDRGVVQRVRALHHSTVLGRVAEAEGRG